MQFPEHHLSGLPCHGPSNIRTVYVIGAGLMGRGIAMASLRAGMHVIISDQDVKRADAAVRQLRAETESASFSAKASPPFPRLMDQPDCRLDKASSQTQIRSADLVIEAVSEQLESKQAALSEIESYLKPEAIVATNTSSIPITKIASALKQPDRLCGLHFCYPVEQRSLVELIVATQTSKQTIEWAERYVRALRKSPVIVRDGPGFALNRVLTLYLTEALELLLEGVDIGLLNRLAVEFGMPCGPLHQIDQFGLPVCLSVGRTLFQAYPDRFIPSELLIALHQRHRRDPSVPSRFYVLDKDAAQGRLNPAVVQIIKGRRRSSTYLSWKSVRPRLLLPMVFEAMRVVEESVVENMSMMDTILREGLGLTERFEGIASWIDTVGTGEIRDSLQILQTLGSRFSPPASLSAFWPRRAA